MNNIKQFKELFCYDSKNIIQKNYNKIYDLFSYMVFLTQIKEKDIKWVKKQIWNRL